MIKTVGLLLQSVPYLGKKKILKVFTKDHGLLSFFVNETKLTPFCLGEWIYRKTEKEMHSLKEANLLDPLEALRGSYETLLAAGAIAKDLLTTQMPNKKSDDLFDLTYLYLKKLPQNPESLRASFRLKLLLHEGLLDHDPHPQFTKEEWDQVEILAFGRSIQSMQSIKSAPHAKIDALFAEKLTH